MTFLSKEEIERIHRASMRILGEIGIKVHSDVVSKILMEAGAVRTRVDNRLRIPEHVVKDALASAPKSVLLVGRNDVKDIRIPDQNRMYVATGGEGIHITDLVKGTSRKPMLKDVHDIAVIVDSLQQIDFFWQLVSAQDLHDKKTSDLIEMKTVLENNCKHIQSGALNAAGAKREIEMASIIAGGEKELAKRPILSAVECPFSPLVFEEGLSEAQVVYAKAGIPLVSMSAAMAGLTSPVTIAGTIAQINAENMASLVITQGANKGAPWIYSSDSVPANLRRGTIDYGALEANLMRTAAAEMARFYGLPVMCGGIGLEGTAADLKCIADGVPIMLNQALVPSDLGSGFGGLDNAAGASIEGIIVDAWVWDVARESIREFDADDDAISVETISEGVKDGNFLTKKHTLARFRKELSTASHPEATSSLKGEKNIPGAVAKKAQREVKDILRAHKEPVLARDISKELDAVIDRARKEGK